MNSSQARQHQKLAQAVCGVAIALFVVMHTSGASGQSKLDRKHVENRNPDAGALRLATKDDISSALLRATEQGSVEEVKLLLENSNPEAVSAALTTARMNCEDDLVALLKHAGAVEPPNALRKAPRFKEFPVKKVYRGKPPIVYLDSSIHPDDRKRMRAEIRKGSNFAGHYTFSTASCGSSCESDFIVDQASGHVYNPDYDERGVEYRLDSRLVILNPREGPEEFAYRENVSDTLPVRYYVWERNKMRLVFSEPCWVKNEHQICGCKAKTKEDEQGQSFPH